MTATESAPALKNIFDLARFRHIAAETAAVVPGFDRDRFVALATDGLDAMGIMERMRRMAQALNATLPEGYPRQLSILRDLGPRVGHSFAAIALSEFVALYGQHDFNRSMQALADLTRYGSSEFAVRHFLLADFQRAIATMRGWTGHADEHVRRLASEGSRPRLPWSFQLRNLVADPSPTLPLLDALKADDSLYVRKSVANHLNDIGKDHPRRLIETVSDWSRDDGRTAWIVRHALRTLIKKGHADALAIVGATGEAQVAVEGFDVTPASIALGERIVISGALTSTGDRPQRLVVDYAIRYVKKNGTASPKVFKLKVLDLAPGERVDLLISQTVRDFTTRRHHAGRHVVELLVNGKVLAESAFELRLPGG